MRVLYVSKALRVAAYRDKLQALSARLDVVAVIPARWGSEPLEAGDAQSGAVITWPTLFHGHNHFHLYRKAGRLLERFRPDLVHIDEEPYSAVTGQWTALCRRRSVPCLFFAWQNLVKRLPPPFPTLRRYVYQHVTGGIAGTTAAAAVLRRTGFTGALTVVPQLGVDPSRFRSNREDRTRMRARLGLSEGELVVGFGGRLVPEKGVDLLVAAFASLGRGHLVLLGDGPERKRLAEAARRAGLAGRIHFVGAVPSLEMPAWLAGLDVLALPSRSTRRWSEQFGRILVEAMACGVAVVGSDCGEIPRVIGTTGLVVPQGDARALHRALLDLAEQPERRRALARRAWRRMLQSFTHDRIARDTAAFYELLLDDCPGRADSPSAPEASVGAGPTKLSLEASPARTVALRSDRFSVGDPSTPADSEAPRGPASDAAPDWTGDRT